MVVKRNEVDEYLSSFPDLRNEILELKNSYVNLGKILKKAWSEIDPGHIRNIDKNTRKELALKVDNISKKYSIENWKCLFFSLFNKKVLDIDDYLFDYDTKRLNDYLRENKNMLN